MFALYFRPGLQERRPWGLFVFAFLLALPALQPEALAQGGRGRQPIKTPSSTPAPGPKQNGGKRPPIKRTPVPAKVAALSINLPDGSRVWLNQTEVELRNSDRSINIGKQKITTTYSLDQGILTVTGLKPGLCHLTVRKPDHKEFTQTLDLLADRSNAITVQLMPIPGTLTVKPTVNGTSVEVSNPVTNMSLGRHTGQLERFEIVPGNY